MAKRPAPEPQAIVAAYKAMVAAGEQPINAHTLAERADMTAEQFAQFFASADEVGRKAWSDYLAAIQAQLGKSETYQGYSARQKMIAYFFSLVETLGVDRAFIEKTRCKEDLIKDYKAGYKAHMAEVVQEGLAMSDVHERFGLSKYYPDVLWLLHSRLVEFWLDDTSEDYTATERAIEIYSKLPLELMGSNVLDSLVETVRFAVEQIRFDKIFR
jgi:Tetracyclin repressor-like, C-terminal domain